MKFRIFIVLSLLFSAAAAVAQNRNMTAVAFYNVENLYDTLPSRFYDDTPFTPQGRKGWNTERYARKIVNIGRVIDEMSADVLGLAEVENEAVVRDLVNSLSTDYNYIHASTSDSRGMDLAVLYKGDRFFPDSVSLVNSKVGREFLYVRGQYCGADVQFVFCHLPSRLNKPDYCEKAFYELHRLIYDLLDEKPDANVIVLGDFNASPVEKLMRLYMGRSGAKDAFMTCVLNDVYRSGFGSYFADGTWLLFDNIFVNPDFFRNSGFKLADAGVYAQPYMLHLASDGKTLVGGGRRNVPLRTFEGNKYLGGYSDHLPVFMVLEKQDR